MDTANGRKVRIIQRIEIHPYDTASERAESFRAFPSNVPASDNANRSTKQLQ